MRNRSAVLLPVALMLAYTLLSHAAAHWHLLGLQWLALSVLLTVPIAPALIARRPWAWLALPALLAALWVLTHAGGGQLALFLPPVLLPLVLSLSFGLTLLPEHTPMITAIALAVHGSLPEPLMRYTCRLTLFWALFSFALALIALPLAWTGPLWLWSVHTNFIAYALVATVFVGEYALRRRWFPDHPHPGFLDYLGIVVRSRPRLGR